MPSKIVGINKLTKKLLKLPPETTKVLKDVVAHQAERVEITMKESVSKKGTGRIYQRWNPKRLHQASRPFGRPATDTGRLLGDIATQFVIAGRGLAAEVGTGVDYAEELEFGTSKAAPRPFIRVAFRAHRREREAAFKAAVNQVLKSVARGSA